MRNAAQSRLYLDEEEAQPLLVVDDITWSKATTDESYLSSAIARAWACFCVVLICGLVLLDVKHWRSYANDSSTAADGLEVSFTVHSSFEPASPPVLLTASFGYAFERVLEPNRDSIFDAQCRGCTNESWYAEWRIGDD